MIAIFHPFDEVKSTIVGIFYYFFLQSRTYLGKSANSLHQTRRMSCGLTSPTAAYRIFYNAKEKGLVHHLTTCKLLTDCYAWSG